MEYGAGFTGHNNAIYKLTGSMGWLPIALVALAIALVLLLVLWREKLLRLSDFAALAGIALFSLVFALLAHPYLLLSEGGVISEQTYDFLATWVYGGAFLAAMIWFMAFGHRRNSDTHIWLALLGFAAEILYIYFRIFGSLLETSLFFFVGGIITLVLAFFLYQINQRMDEGDEAGNSSANPRLRERKNKEVRS